MLEINSVLLLLYGGPDQLIPIASVLGAIIGFLLIVWQRLFGLLRRAFKFVGQKLRLIKE